jgi:hypothetical protein
LFPGRIRIKRKYEKTSQITENMPNSWFNARGLISVIAAIVLTNETYAEKELGDTTGNWESDPIPKFGRYALEKVKTV